MEYLLRFNFFSRDFDDFCNHLVSIEWKIENQLLKERASRYSMLSIFLNLKKKFLEKNLSIWKLNDEEVVTWLDTIILMSRINYHLKKIYEYNERILVFMEYNIPYGNHMRADYILVFGKSILVLEFGMFNQDEKRGNERYSKKLIETVSYRQTLANLLPNDIKVYNYVLIYKPEYNLFSKENMKDNLTYNEFEIKKLVSYIKMLIDKEFKMNAIYSLEKL